MKTRTTLLHDECNRSIRERYKPVPADFVIVYIKDCYNTIRDVIEVIVP